MTIFPPLLAAFFPSLALFGDPVQDLGKWIALPAATRPALSAQAFAEIPLSRTQADQALELLRVDRIARVKAASAAEWQAGAFKYGAYTMKFLYKTFGAKPADGRSLFISMHGGGSAPASVNDEQWQNQINLYQPAEGIYLAPRAPTDDWDLWHQREIDPLFDRIIQACVAYLDVNSDKVYLMGYSAGGDGVYQLAPRMADRWAAAAMMAGHPNDASPLNLRNLGFTIHVGALDSAYNRNAIALRWKAMLDSLAQADPGGYPHFVQLHAGLPHWMNQEDTVAVPWMAKFRRNPVPSKVVWRQDDVTHPRLYWLAEPYPFAGALVRAEAARGNLSVTAAEGVTALTLNLNDALIDLDQDVTVDWLGRRIFQGHVNRTIRNLSETLEAGGDARLAFSGRIDVVDGRVAAVPRAVRRARRRKAASLMPRVLFNAPGRNGASDAAGRSAPPSY